MRETQDDQGRNKEEPQAGASQTGAETDASAHKRAQLLVSICAVASAVGAAVHTYRWIYWEPAIPRGTASTATTGVSFVDLVYRMGWGVAIPLWLWLTILQVKLLRTGNLPGPWRWLSLALLITCLAAVATTFLPRSSVWIVVAQWLGVCLICGFWLALRSARERIAEGAED